MEAASAGPELSEEPSQVCKGKVNGFSPNAPQEHTQAGKTQAWRRLNPPYLQTQGCRYQSSALSLGNSSFLFF